MTPRRAAVALAGFLALLAGALALAALCSPARAQTAPAGGGAARTPPVYSPGQYNDALAALSRSVAARIDPDRAGEAQGPAPRQALQPILYCQVRDPGGRWLVTVDNSPLARALDSAAGEPDETERRSRFRQILQQVAMLRQGVEPTGQPAAPAESIGEMRRILLEPQYASEPSPPPSLLEREADRFSRWLQRMLDKLHGPKLPAGHIDPRVPLYILIGIGIVAAGVLVAYIVTLVSRRLARRGRAVSLPESSLALNAQEASLVATRDFDRLLDLARRHGEDGDFRSALRLVYLATLVYLDAEGFVRLNRSKTNWEYLRSVRAAGHTALYGALVPTTQAFDRIWYGVRPASREDYQSALDSHAQVRSLLETPAERRTAAASAR